MKKNVFPLITAHAGCLQTPPNSLSNVFAAINAGADIVEVDVNTTKDGVAILFHDQEVQTPSRGIVPVNMLTFEEIRAIVQITRLEEVLPVLRQSQTPINLDLKSPACLEPMQAVVKACEMVELAIISGCQKEDAVFVKSRYPEFQVLLNAEENVVDLDANKYAAYIRKTCQDAIAAACCGININYQDCRVELLQYARLRCLPVLLYTVDQPADMNRFLRLGVHSITTNEVRTLIALREQISR